MLKLRVIFLILAGGLLVNAGLFEGAASFGLFSEPVYVRSTGAPLSLVPVIVATALGGLAAIVGRLVLAGLIRNRRRARALFVGIVGLVTLVSFGSPGAGLVGVGLAEILMLNAMHVVAAVSAGFAAEWTVRPEWRFGREAYPSRTINPPVAVVTGATSGIGAEVALELARRGYRVLGIGRCVQRARELEAKLPHLTVINGDLSLMQSAQRIAAQVNHLAGPPGVGLLVHCVGTLQPVPRRTPEGMEANFATSFLGRFALTEALQLAPGCRVVNVAAAERGTLPAVLRRPLAQPDDLGVGMQAHGQAQLANDLWTASLARRGISAYGYGPGAVETRIRRELPAWVVALMKPIFAVDLRSPEDAAQDIVRLLLDESLPRAGFASRDGRFEHHAFILDPCRQDELVNLARLLVANALKSGFDAGRL